MKQQTGAEEMRNRSKRLADVLVFVNMVIMAGGCAGSSRYGTPHLANIAEFRGEHRGPLLLHFTSEQWSQVTAEIADVEQVEDVTKVQNSGIKLIAQPLPGSRGDWLVQVDCDADCEVYSRRWDFWKVIKDLTIQGISEVPGPDEVFYPSCACNPPGTPHLGKPECQLLFWFDMKELRLKPVCIQTTCPNPCKLVQYRDLYGRVRLICGCSGVRLVP
jgi:hypothetical protein